jgi:hypothetical protein
MSAISQAAGYAAELSEEDKAIAQLIEFFEEERNSKQGEIDDWIAQGEQDFDQFFAAIARLKRRLKP